MSRYSTIPAQYREIFGCTCLKEHPDRITSNSILTNRSRDIPIRVKLPLTAGCVVWMTAGELRVVLGELEVVARGQDYQDL